MPDKGVQAAKAALYHCCHVAASVYHCCHVAASWPPGIGRCRRVSATLYQSLSLIGLQASTQCLIKGVQAAQAVLRFLYVGRNQSPVR